MNRCENKYFPGIDILKYIMALLIVATHSQLFHEWEWLQEVFAHLTDIAVPTFFAISAYLFFTKLDNPTFNEGATIKRMLKRLIIIFIVWYVIMLPMTYIRFFSAATLKEIIWAGLLGCTFSGYWFLKALIINIAIVSLCRGRKKMFVCTFFSTLVYLFFAYDYLHGSLSTRIHPYYSFYYHTVFFSIGALLARYENYIQQHSPSKTILIILLFLAFFISFIPNFRIFSKLVYPIVLVRLSLSYKGKHLEWYKHMRISSILYYMLHFTVIFIITDNCSMNSISLYITVLLIVTILSELIIHLESKAPFAFLKYLH